MKRTISIKSPRSKRNPPYTDPDYPILQVAEYYRDGAIIQRGRPIPVWGHANQGVAVTVTLGGVTQSAVANDRQQWSVSFPALTASTQPITLSVKSSHGHSRTVQNILVGDVWFVTGGALLTSEPAFDRRNKQAVAPEAMPLVREFRRRTAASTNPVPKKRGFEVGGGKYRTFWQTADFKADDDCVSMFAYEFAKALNRPGIPQGFVTMSSGQGAQMASPLSWTSYAGVKDATPPAFRVRLDALRLQDPSSDVSRKATADYVQSVKSAAALIADRAKQGAGPDRRTAAISGVSGTRTRRRGQTGHRPDLGLQLVRQSAHSNERVRPDLGSRAGQSWLRGDRLRCRTRTLRPQPAGYVRARQGAVRLCPTLGQVGPRGRSAEDR